MGRDYSGRLCFLCRDRNPVDLPATGVRYEKGNLAAVLGKIPVISGFGTHQPNLNSKEITKMTFNYALEKKKFDQAWESLRKFYVESGMEPEAIEAMHEYDWNAFKAARIEALHTQELKLPEEMDDESEAPESPLMKKFGKQLTTEYDTFGGHSRYWWIDELTTPCLTIGVPLLTDDDKEILTMFIVDGLTTREIAARMNTNPMKISRRLQKLFSYFK